MRARLAILLALAFAGIGRAAERFTLSPETYSNAVPAGKEVDACFGDYVLRNEQLVAVIADPGLIEGRSASRKINPRQEGCLIDLARRQAPNDLLHGFAGAALPAGPAVLPATLPGEPGRQAEFRDEALAARDPGRGPVTAACVSVEISHVAPLLGVRYSLEDGRPYVLAEAVYSNATDKPLAVQPAASLFMSPRPFASSRQFVWGWSRDGRAAWIYDPWFGQAYAVAAAEPLATGPGMAKGPFLSLVPGGEGEVTLSPGATCVLAHRLFPAADAFAARRLVDEWLGVAGSEVRFVVSDSDGPVSNALLSVQAPGEACPYAAGRTDTNGFAEARLPEGPYRIRVQSVGRPFREQDLRVGPPGAAEAAVCRVVMGGPGRVAIAATDEGGASIPCKVEFRGVDGTPNPFFFPETGEEQVSNLWYLARGSAEGPVPTGRYEVVIAHGPEFEIDRRRIEVTAGGTTLVEASLARSVDSTGWISADFGNRSTVSRAYSLASQRGRVLNLLAEHIEFAPCTERDFVSSFQPHVAALGCEGLMATCPGVGLTERVRKGFTSQNAFPVRWRPGGQDGGAIQRPQHVLQVWWLGTWYAPLRPSGSPGWVGPEKLIQVTPPDVWEYDGRFHGMWWLFGAKYATESCNRDGRLVELRSYHAMELQPLSSFLDLPPYDPQDPKGEQDLEGWREEMNGWAQTKEWPKLLHPNREWLRMLNMGYRITGVVNGNAYANDHGSGSVRNFVFLGKDNPAAVDAMDVVRAVKAGHVVMSTGPFVDVAVQSFGARSAVGRGMPGEDVDCPGGRAALSVKIQGPTWIGIDAVQVLWNGRPVPDLRFTRESHPDWFAEGVVKVDQSILLELAVDTHVMVLVEGHGPDLRGGRGADDGTVRHVALSNPVYVDVDGGGFSPHSPVLDTVFTRMDVLQPIRTAPARQPGRVRVKLKNVGRVAAQDSFGIRVRPAGAAEIRGTNRFDYVLAPGEERSWDVEVASTGEASGGTAVELNIPRSSVGAGRREVGLRLPVDPAPGYDLKVLSPAQVWWIPETVPDRPPNLDFPEYGR